MRLQSVLVVASLALTAAALHAQSGLPPGGLPSPYAPTSWRPLDGQPDPAIVNVGAPTMATPAPRPLNLPPSLAPQYIPADRFQTHDCAPCAPGCAPTPRAWVETDVLLWWLRSAPVPVLVTQGPAASGAILGRAGTTNLFGGSDVEQGAFAGVRFTAGAWLDDAQTLGVEGNYFTLFGHANSVVAGNDGSLGSPVVSRPFFNANSGLEDSELVAFPGTLAGTVRVNVATRLDGVEFDGLLNLCGDCCWRLDVLGGFRYLQLNDGVSVREDLAVLPTVPGVGGERFIVTDDFHARTSLYAGQLGARATVRRGNWDAVVTAKLAMGDSHEQVSVNGTTVTTTPGGATTTAAGGLLALPSNIGGYSRDVFAVAPEGSLRLGYQLTRNLHASLGYDFLYWSPVVRAGEQIDRTLNPNQIPATQPTGATTTGTRPAFTFHETGFWAQGLTFSLEFCF